MFGRASVMCCVRHERSTRSTMVRRFPYAVIFFLDHGEPVIVAIAHGKRWPYHWRDRLR